MKLIMMRSYLVLACLAVVACKQSTPAEPQPPAATPPRDAPAQAAPAAPPAARPADVVPADLKTYCEEQWHAADKPAPGDSLRCAAHWLRYGYREGYTEEDLMLDPTPGGPISVRFTSEQFLRMQAHVRAAASTQCDDIDKEPIACRAIGYFSLESDCHLNLIDPWLLEEILPLLGKVLRGEELARRDLAPEDEGGPRWSSVTLWRLRNAVFARHGRSFENPDLERFFYGAYPTKLAGELLPRSKNPGYMDQLLTETDRNNIKLIKSFE